MSAKMPGVEGGSKTETAETVIRRSAINIPNDGLGWSIRQSRKPRKHVPASYPKAWTDAGRERRRKDSLFKVATDFSRIYGP